jgi:hypothetical protein
MSTRLTSAKTSRKDTRVALGLRSLEEIFQSRLRRTFDMVFLSRVKAKEASLIFEFSCEDLEASSIIDPTEAKMSDYGSYLLSCPGRSELASTFGLNDQPIWSPVCGLYQLESLKFEESFIDKEDIGARRGGRLMFIRLEKLLYLRVAATFNRLAEM